MAGKEVAAGEEILISLNSAFPIVKKLFGVARIGIFGTLARGEGIQAGPPVIEVEFGPGQETYANFIGLLFFLEERLSLRVELVTARTIALYSQPDQAGERGDEILLERVLAECSFITARSRDLQYEQFARDELFRRAASESLEVIAAILSLVSEETILRYQNIRWKEIRAIPSVLLHSRFGPDPVILWNILLSEIPALESHIRSILRK
ncbi:MAG: DUF86 domain-containing protein [Methanoregulaceae archaeon]|nr:DUF86 domain-containing protein [Methanoregulaceae archaeon]